MNNQKYYYTFRKLNISDGAVFVLYIFDRSARLQLNAVGSIFLTANGVIVGTVRPIEQLTYKDLAKMGNLEPHVVIEINFKDVENVLRNKGLWSNSGVIKFECVDSEGMALSPSAYFGYPVGIEMPIPTEENIKRVGGTMSADGFLVSGASWYEVINNVIKQDFGRDPISKDSNILDWGVGCGRIMRYFINDGYENLYGLDIDQFNIDWCQKNLPGAQYLRCDFDPPTEFPDNKFDLIHAHSVFTHLTEKDEKAWLTELNRILSPNGIGCVTFLSEFGIHLMHNSTYAMQTNFWSEFMSLQRIDLGVLSVGVDAGREGYYRNVAHTVNCVTNEWSQFINVEKIIHGFADNQDAVIFTKKQ